MAVRSSMAALIARVRVLINDTLPVNNGQIFTDQTIQDVMDESRQDYTSFVLEPRPTFSGSTIQWLDYYSELGGWEDDYVIKQYLINQVTPSLSEPISGHWQFSTTTLPPLYITGKLYDVYRSAADLLERQAAQWVLRYSMSVDGQNLQRGQVATALQTLAHTYRRKQRAMSIQLKRTDIGNQENLLSAAGGPTEIDYMADGNGH